MKKTIFHRTLWVLLALPLALGGCEGGRGKGKAVSATSGGGYYKVGKPYKIKGEWYYPQENYLYDETGIASWYGAEFHNKLTANGEVYNKNELTAAHKTLQMPSLARVTNLENGRAIVVRINDRGPYSSGRIIDLSQRSAQLLGFERQGTAKVRVQVLADESKAIAEAMRTYGASPATSSGPQPQLANVSQEPVIIESKPLAPQPSLETVKPVPQYVQGPVTGGTNLYVQAGSFANKSNALRLQKSLSTLGKAFVTEAVVKGALFYRVRIGPLSTVAKADKMLDNVRHAGVNDARILVDD